MKQVLQIARPLFACIMNVALLALTALICGASLAAAEPTRAPTIEQTIGAERWAGGRISPDGRMLAYVVERADWEANSFGGELWLADTASGERRQLTFTKKWNGGARWSPDGRWIGFLSDRSGSWQIYLISPSGGEAVALTKVDGGLNDFRWSSDGRHIAFTATDSGQDQVREAQRKRDGDVTILEPGSHTSSAGNHLWRVEVPSPVRMNAPPEPVRLTSGKEYSVTDFAWSPDSTRIAFSGVADTTPKARSTADIYVLDLPSGAVRKVVDLVGPDTAPVWSPDGRQIAFETANGSLTYFETNSFIAVVSAEGGTPRLLSKAIDEQPTLLSWGPDAIYFALQRKTALHLFRMDPTTKQYSRISGPDAFVGWYYSFTSDYRKVAFASASASSYPDIYVADLGRFRPKRLTAFDEQFSGHKPASREVISWIASDGTRVEGVLMKPSGFDHRRKYPLLVVLHGGPADVSRPTLGITYPYPVEQLAAKGALILQPNYRGSTGYGEAFRTPNPRTLSDYEDVVSGVKHLVDRGMADRGRIGVMGWSQGGYLSALLATKGSEWFRAASVGAGVPNWLTYYTNGDAGYWAAQWFKASPLQDPEVYRLKSPISYIKNANTPVLIQHGERDRRAPIEGAYEFYKMLEDRNVPVRMIVYDGEGHVVGSPKGLRALMEQNMDWFSRWVWDDHEK